MNLINFLPPSMQISGRVEMGRFFRANDEVENYCSEKRMRMDKKQSLLRADLAPQIKPPHITLTRKMELFADPAGQIRAIKHRRTVM